MQIFLAPLTPNTYQQIVALHEIYELTSPPFPEQALIATNEKMEVIASVFLYETRPFLLAEFAIANPAVDLKTRHQAAELLVDAYTARAAMGGLVPMCPLRSKGIASILRRKGYWNTGCPMWTNQAPLVPMTTYRPDPVYTVDATSAQPEEEKKVKPKRRKRK